MPLLKINPREDPSANDCALYRRNNVGTVPPAFRGFANGGVISVLSHRRFRPFALVASRGIHFVLVVSGDAAEV